MPTYVYQCTKCAKRTEIVKSMHDSGREEICSECSITLSRVYTTFQILGAKVEDAEFNPGLGCVTKSAKHRAEIAKQKDLIEVGNETPDTLYKETVVKREQEREKEWERL